MLATGLEGRVQQTGREIYSLLEDDTPSAFRKDYWTGKVLDWCLRDEAFKTQMFRFVDVFPSLRSSEEVSRRMQEYFDRPDLDLSGVLQWGLRAFGGDSMAAGLVRRGVDRNIRSMAGQFIAGAEIGDALDKLHGLRKQGAAFSISLLGEAVVSEKEADEYAQRYLDVLDALHREEAKWPALGSGADASLDWGGSPRVNVSVKPTAMYSQMRPQAFDKSVDAAKERLRPIFRKAMETGAAICFDMEHRQVKNLTLALLRGLLEEPEFSGWPHAGAAVQAYLRETQEDLDSLIEWSAQRKQPLTVRLIKGAYWDAELVRARQKNWPPPVWTDKARTDVAFEEAARRILESRTPVRLACGSHNIRSIAYVRELSREMEIPEERVEYQVLYGMAGPIRRALVKKEFPVRVYTPVGELLPGMAYLVRRLLENTSNESFLRRSFAQGAAAEETLWDPREKVSEEADRRWQEPERSETGFANEPPLDWTLPETRERFQKALDKVRGRFPIRAPLWIGGRAFETGREILSVNPNRTAEVAAVAASAGRAEAESAVAAAREAFPAWRDTDPQERAKILLRAAKIARGRRYELAALQVLEEGKAWSEADGDVCEAIDFLEYYAREMIRLAAPQELGRAPGEDDRLFYEPRGVAAVIAPWNFPMAISAGMVSASLVTGNTVVYKPSSDSVAAGYEVVKILREAGVPDGALNFIPGPGSEAGRTIVEHRDVALIAFTGSREAGLDIVRRAAQLPEGAQAIKQVIAEMGGKNAVILDTDAELDEAIAEVVHSAFGYQGQKCSACSRLILPDAVYDEVLERLRGAVESLPLGPVEDPQAVVGAVISGSAKEKIERYVELGKRGLKLAVERRFESAEGYFAPLAVFSDVPPDHPLAQEEIFGPVLSVIRVKDFDEALEVANATDYALTGSVFSRSPENIRKARERFRAGNLYINRGCTGAIVERHPFGGFKMSGVGSKAGGPDYLRQFMVPRAVAENTMRRGFTPGVS